MKSAKVVYHLIKIGNNEFVLFFHFIFLPVYSYLNTITKINVLIKLLGEYMFIILPPHTCNLNVPTDKSCFQTEITKSGKKWP